MFWVKVSDRKELRKGQTAIYRICEIDKSGNIIGMYIGQSANVHQRYYDYYRPYEERHRKQYPTDFMVSEKMQMAIQKGNNVNFEILHFDDYHGIRNCDMNTKSARVAIESFEIFAAIKSGYNVWNKD